MRDDQGRQQAPRAGRRRVDLYSSPFAVFHVGPAREQRILGYILREHRRGRPLAEILDDRYLARWTAEQLGLVLELPALIRGLADDLAVERSRGLRGRTPMTEDARVLM
jgi:hypothetical protein